MIHRKGVKGLWALVFCLMLFMGLSTSYAAPTADDLRAQEEEPLQKISTVKEISKTPISMKQWWAILLVFAGSGVCTFVVVKFVFKRRKKAGSRPFLIEQVSHCSLGAKAGVSLLKVGNEFILVGVTPSQITHLSSLPRLQSRYEEDARFERDAFGEAVAEEIKHIKRQSLSV